MFAVAVVLFDISDVVVAGFNNTPLKHRIHLVGERHSGTKWIHEHLVDCFSPRVAVRSGFDRGKHWFQHDGDYSERKRVVVAQFRHSYHWVEAMRDKPHHAPEHFDLTWQEFVTRPWTMPRKGKDVNVTLLGTEKTCQKKFRPNEVIPCLEIEADATETGHMILPLYEMRSDGSGKPYDSILELRADKIKNFLSIADFHGIQDLFAVQYEQMVRNGTATLIRNIEEALGVKAQCSPMAPQSLSPRSLPPEYVKWMKEHVDWKTEALIGYDDGTF
jgi:hypothetical protein